MTQLNACMSSTSTLKDFIYIKEDMFTPDFCNLIVNEYCHDDLWSESPTINNANTIEFGLATGRSSESLNLSEQQVISKNSTIRQTIDDEIFNIVTKQLNYYLERTPFINITTDEGYVLLRYKPGGYVGEHVDTLMGPAIGINGHYEQYSLVPRHITTIIQLNDNYKGGRLSFFNKEYKIPQKQGCGIFFPSYRIFPHEVSPVTHGIRYTLTTFFK